MPSGLTMQVKVASAALHVYQGRAAGCHLPHVLTGPTGSGGQAGCSMEQLRDGAGSFDLPLEESPSLHLPRETDVLTHRY